MSKFFNDTMQGLLEAAAIQYSNKSDAEQKKIEFKPCPICGGKVEIHGGEIDWRPTYYDPDSGNTGSPYYIRCECGIEFDNGFYDLSKIADAWNTRKG